ncbi:pro-Pol polyprotein [Trichonephila clavipes]|nr:pro-Pol polyprotein [Trichonephila clavipes]
MAPKELSELTVFNRRKAHLLGQITRIRNSLENVDSPLNQVEIRTKLASLSEVKAKIDKLRTESYRILSDEELIDFETSLDTMEVDADNLEVSLNTLLESSKVDTSELSVKNDFANYNVKLPSINLPEFSGQYIDWLQFKSQFVSLIHDNACLSDSQKLYYLQSALKGHAKQLQTVNDSYSSLFEALGGRYENKRLIVNSHIAELLNPNKIKFESAFHLRCLIDSIQSHLRALKQLELEPNALCESMLIFVITQRLDDESRKQYEMELHSNDLPKWNNFLNFLIKRSQALENVQRNSSLKNKNEYSPKFRSFVVKSNEKPVSVMSFRDTPNFKCKMFHEMSVQERSNKVRSLNLCFNCLGHHLIKNCLKLNRKCRVCNANHNSLLCKTSVPRQINRNLPSPQSSSGVIYDPSPANVINPQTATCLYNESGEKSILLSTAKEVSHAENWLIHSLHEREFYEEMRKLLAGEPIPMKSKLTPLNVFLDESNIIRVGGRLSNSNLNEKAKFPIILPSRNVLTDIILSHYHKKYLHAGPHSLLYLVRQKFWPLNGRNNCRRIIHECVNCFKNKPITMNQIMANLPRDRVTPNYPFNVMGVDFAGPFFIKFKNQRKGALNKIYVVVYVCLCTKAIHLDFVTDLTSQAFIASLKRFFGRRRKCAKITTDNAKTFVVANAETKKLFKMIKLPDHTLAEFLTNESIEWNFIPPRSPNHGGLWEAGVKAFKFHLKRVVGNAHLTLEEFITILCEIEAVLNSRPLTPLTSNFDDFETLTPGHFLVGTLVLIKDENLPTTKWSTGRITEIFPGTDGKVRVVNLRMPNGNILKGQSEIFVYYLSGRGTVTLSGCESFQRPYGQRSSPIGHCESETLRVKIVARNEITNFEKWHYYKK